MDRSYKPQGYSSVSAYVVANGAQDVIDFLIKSFDARQTRRYDLAPQWCPGVTEQIKFDNKTVKSRSPVLGPRPALGSSKALEKKGGRGCPIE